MQDQCTPCCIFSTSRKGGAFCGNISHVGIRRGCHWEPRPLTSRLRLSLWRVRVSHGAASAHVAFGSISIENATNISDEQRGSALAGLDGSRRLVASSGPAVCLLSAGGQSASVLLRSAAGNAVLPDLVRPAVL